MATRWTAAGSPDDSQSLAHIVHAIVERTQLLERAPQPQLRQRRLAFFARRATGIASLRTFPTHRRRRSDLLAGGACLGLAWDLLRPLLLRARLPSPGLADDRNGARQHGVAAAGHVLVSDGAILRDASEQRRCARIHRSERHRRGARE